MAIPHVPRDELLAALELFDSEQRNTADWAGWESRLNHKYAIQHEGRLYPVKHIIALATGVGTNTFSGGSEANGYVEQRGFRTVELHTESPSTVAPKTNGLTAAEQEVAMAVERLVPQATSRPALLEVFARSIEQAAATAPANWAMSLSSTGLRLTVGHRYVCTIHKGMVWLAFAPRVLTPATIAVLEREMPEYGNDQYRPIGAVGGYLTADRGERLFPLVQPAHWETIQDAAQEMLRQASKAGHNAAVITYLEKQLGRRLPQPTYAAQRPAPVPATAPFNITDLIQRFTERYGSFTSDAYLNDERNYKVEASRKLRELLSEERMRSHIEHGDWSAAKEDIKRSMWGNNLLNQWDVRAVMDAPDEPLTRALYDLLHGSGPFDTRFDGWVNVLAHKTQGVWPAATYYLMLQFPDTDIFVKPTQFQYLLRAIHHDIKWPTRPTARFYTDVRTLGELLRSQLQPLGARDMIDVQSFIWAGAQEDEDDEIEENEGIEAAAPGGKSAADAGVNTAQQLLIALQAMVDAGGTATTAQLYSAVQRHMHGSQLNKVGRDTLRSLINRDAVRREYVQAYDKQNPGWHITEKGRRFLAANPAPTLPIDQGTSQGGRSMARLTNQAAIRIYAAMGHFVDAALRSDDAVFTPGRTVWTAENIADLYVRFVQNPDERSDVNYWDKLKGQLRGASPDVYQLTAEILFLHYLPAGRRNASGANKRRSILGVLGWAPEPVALPDDLAVALDDGIAAMGQAFNLFKYWYVAFLIEWVRAWKRLPTEGQTRLLDDPWAFKEMLFSVPIQAAYGQREILLHLIHPDTFEPIASREDKQKIVQAFAQYVTEPTNDIDRRLLQIRQRLSSQYGADFHFYAPAIYEQWNRPSTPVLPPPEPFDALGADLRSYVRLAVSLGQNSFTPEGIVDLVGRLDPKIADLSAAPDPDNLVTDLVLLRLLERTDDGRYRRWQHLSDGTEAHMLRYAALTLLLPMEGDDNVHTLPIMDVPRDGLAHAASEWPGGEPLLRWYETAGLVERAESGWKLRETALQPMDATTATARTVNTFLEHLQRVLRAASRTGAIDTDQLPILDVETLNERIAEIQRELLIDRQTILRIYRSLIAGRHVILSGPPGTGKTHLARILPRVLWRETFSTHLVMPTRPEQSPIEEPETIEVTRQGYAVDVVTATEEWSVRHVIGGIMPQLQENGHGKTLVYGVRHGSLTRTVLQNYGGDGEAIPADFSTAREPLPIDNEFYRGRWLVIDEFTRAPIDAAFGSLLTTLGGQANTKLSVPTDTGIDRDVPLPRDFRLIGTLNSFDRHFLNQISEAMKRRFTFIDVLPPSRVHAEAEQALAVYRALVSLAQQRLSGITIQDEPRRVIWAGNLEVFQNQEVADEDTLLTRYTLQAAPQARDALASFWRIFSAIRVYRKLGTAQAEAVYATMFAGKSIGMNWATALDSALADVLVDQLQVLARDEQRTIVAYIEYAANAGAFLSQVQTILNKMPAPRQIAHLAQIRAAGATALDDLDPSKLDRPAIESVFTLGSPLLVKADGLFVTRLNEFVHEKGL